MNHFSFVSKKDMDPGRKIPIHFSPCLLSLIVTARRPLGVKDKILPGLMCVNDQAVERVVLAPPLALLGPGCPALYASKVETRLIG